jgi:hypothetical protein
VDAMISGRAGVALIIEGGTIRFTRHDAKSIRLQLNPTEIALLLGSVRDWEFQSNVKPWEVTSRLAEMVDIEAGLDLSLVLLDPGMPSIIRERAAGELDMSLASPGVECGLQAVLFAKPLPASADLEGALRSADTQKATVTRTMLGELMRLQPEIRSVRGEWEKVPDSTFGGEQERRHCELQLVRSGVFRDLVLALHSRASVDDVLFASFQEPSVAPLSNCRAILSSWTARFQFEAYVLREIESYKESVSRAHLMRIADLASRTLSRSPGATSTAESLASEVDRIIARRLKLPAFNTWRRRRSRNADEPKRPEYWGLRADTPLQAVLASLVADSPILVVGARVIGTALFLAANGRDVQALESDSTVAERVLQAASDAGLAERVTGYPRALQEWTPSGSLSGVVVTYAAFEALSSNERARVIGLMKAATDDGGLHIIEGVGQASDSVGERDLRDGYADWQTSFVQEPGSVRTFIARKTQK